MNAVLIMVVAFIGYILAYKLYGKYLGQKIFKLSNSAKTPAVEFSDGKDYVPTRKGIIFGHHYTSIAGTGPIVGPAIGIIWGWVPALIWVFFGSIFMGAVHDLGSLIISLRNQGKSISEITSKYVNPRTRTLFFLVVMFTLWIVIAIFGMVIAIIFNMYPQSVFPVWCEIPIAIILGYLIYRKGGNVKLFTFIAVLIMYITVILGHYIPLKMPVIAGISPIGIWSIILFIYCFIASTLPVTTLLQPRDYINAWQLFIAMGLLILGVFAAGLFTGKLQLVAPAFQAAPGGAPPIWPFLFIIIPCGAISGFHSLVSTGTTCKQLSREGDALFVGYGSMLLEGFLAVLVIIAVAAGIGIAYKSGDSILTGTAAWSAHYSTWAAAKGLPAKVGAFVVGAANMIAVLGIPKEIAIIIMGVFVASFAGTTLDTATRIQRYVIQELAGDVKLKVLKNTYVATAFAVITAALLAFSSGVLGDKSGTGALTLWPLFGAVNQTLAGLALITITLYLKRKGGLKYLISGIPCLFMVFMTTWALIVNQKSFIKTGNKLLLIANGIVIVIVIWMIIEGISSFFSKTKTKA